MTGTIDTTKMRDEAKSLGNYPERSRLLVAGADEIDALRAQLAPLDGADAAYVVGALRVERETLAQVTARADRLQKILDDAAKAAVVIGGYSLCEDPDAGNEAVDIPESIEAFGRSIDLLAARAEKAEAALAEATDVAQQRGAQIAALREALHLVRERFGFACVADADERLAVADRALANTAEVAAGFVPREALATVVEQWSRHTVGNVDETRCDCSRCVALRVLGIAKAPRTYADVEAEARRVQR